MQPTQAMIHAGMKALRSTGIKDGLEERTLIVLSAALRHLPDAEPKPCWLRGKTKPTQVFIPEDPYPDMGAKVYVNDKLVEVTWVSRLRDGGTTMIETPAGVIVVPSPFPPERPCTLNGEPLELY